MQQPSVSLESASPNQVIVCDVCGQVWRCERISDLTVFRPRHCPGCGSSRTHATSPGSQGQATPFEAACFASYNQQLLKLLWEDWVASTPEAAHTRNRMGTFAEYVARLVQQAIADTSPTSD